MYVGKQLISAAGQEKSMNKSRQPEGPVNRMALNSQSEGTPDE